MLLLDVAAVCLAFAGGAGLGSGVSITSTPLLVCGSILSVGACAIVIYRYYAQEALDHTQQFDLIPSSIY